ncbi:DUF945 family protein [Candidatus Parabeggiatoa sp. HSG14]|uniref:DUF945 family protein n=1 Tax=Candidatus Parabeggiatoa sp. HSG14 TaxID=3055593 RepID=UPI0025A87839|nr:DUF945 family protein [Thiotrichales bacterium HSG14]
MKKIFQLTITGLLVIFINQPLSAETTEAIEAIEATEATSKRPASNAKVIKSLAAAIKSLSEAVKMLSQSTPMMEDMPLKESVISSPDKTKAIASVPAAPKDSIVSTPAKAKGFTFSGELDTDFLPIKLDFNLPQFKTNNDYYQIDMQNVAFHFKVNTTSKGIDLGNLDFKMGRFVIDVQMMDFATALRDLVVTGVGEEQEGFINYALHTKIGEWRIPDILEVGKDLDISYASDVEFRRIDAKALLTLQQTTRELSKQLFNDEISEEQVDPVLLEKFMEVVPQLLAKSPEIALTSMELETPYGELEGNLILRFDGKKSISFETKENFDATVIPALQAQAEFSVSKRLMEMALMLEFEDETTVNKQLNEIIFSRLLIDVGNDTYKSVVSFQKGQLTVNDQVVWNNQTEAAMTSIDNSQFVNTTRSQLNIIETALDFYRLDMFQYPDNLDELLENTTDNQNWYGPYLEKSLQDPWGNNYQYIRPGREGRDYDLYSYGADGREGGDGKNADIGLE